MAPPRSHSLLGYLPFSASTTALQAVTYLLGISLFSISFLVFLNSSVSFVITDLIGVKHGVGDIAGTLGFADEVVALIACPVWGLVSDRLGVRLVAVIGYTTIGLALFLFVQARNVYPQLLLARIFFAIGATAAATMVTAILPSLTDDSENAARDHTTRPARARNSVALSMDSQATVTPENYRNQVGDIPLRGSAGSENRSKPSALAGFVGLFTGCGALVALSIFLPLPARFSKIEGVTLGEAVADSFYVVGSVSFLVAIFVFFGLRNLKGEDGKGWAMLLGLKGSNPDGTASEERSTAPKQKLLPYWHLLKDSVHLGFTDPLITIGYLGGFVARASTVAISLFVPLFVNSFFMRNGFCQGSPNDPSPELKEECRQAYILSSILTGVAQLMGLICSPLFGYLSSRSGKFNIPIIVATVLGIVGYIAFPQLPSPEFKDIDGRGGSPVVFLLAGLIGISQIGAIVCSLGSLGQGVLQVDMVNVITRSNGDQETVIETGSGASETAPLLENEVALPEDTVSRVRLKGSIAGVYSWCGGAAILLLTKLGGYLFDTWSMGAPFYIMAIFNAILLIASITIDIGKAARRRAQD